MTNEVAKHEGRTAHRGDRSGADEFPAACRESRCARFAASRCCSTCWKVLRSSMSWPKRSSPRQPIPAMIRSRSFASAWDYPAFAGRSTTWPSVFCRRRGRTAFPRLCASAATAPCWTPAWSRGPSPCLPNPSADLATNVFPRTYPAGMSVEVVRSETFERVVPGLNDPGDREHVTSYFYRHAEQFRIVNFAGEAPRRDVHLAVDTPEQFAYVARHRRIDEPAPLGVFAGRRAAAV